jgi:hypothetical protein
MTEDEILTFFRKAVKPGDRVRHKADWSSGTVTERTHPAYELSVRFDRDPDPQPVYRDNLYPEWWPAPGWAVLQTP